MPNPSWSQVCAFLLTPYSEYLQPTATDDDAASDSSASSALSIDPEDPMRDYLISKRKEEKALKKAKKSKSKAKQKDETPEERRARKARRKEKKARKLKSDGMKGVEELLNTLGGRDTRRPRSRTPPARTRSRIRDRNMSIRSRSPPSPGDEHETTRMRHKRYPEENTERKRDSRSRSTRDYD